MEVSRSVYTDLIFHIFAHMKINNASDIYDEAYIENMAKALNRKTVIPESVTAYYCENFEALAFVNFLPYFMTKSTDEVCYMIHQVGRTTQEDNHRFIDPFCNVIREISADYMDYWEQNAKERSADYEELKSYINEQSQIMSSFFESLNKITNTKIKVIISESLRSNGRVTIMGDTCVIILPMPSEQYSLQEIFMQLVHECTHMITDPLLDSIRMDDGSHDVAEYQVMIFDLWLFERVSDELRDAYVKWISKDTLDECEKKLSVWQKTKLRESMI